MTFLKKTCSKKFNYAEFGGYRTYGNYVLHTALLLVISLVGIRVFAVLNKEQKRIGWKDGARHWVWVVLLLLFTFLDVSQCKQNDKKLVKLERASRKQYLKMRA